MPPGVVAFAPWWNMADVESADVCRRASGVWKFESCTFSSATEPGLSLFAARTNLHQPTMPELSAIALGLNGGCCFAYAVLFGLMQNKLLQMYGVEVRYPPRGVRRSCQQNQSNNREFPLTNPCPSPHFQADMKTWTKSDAWDVMIQIMRIVGAFEFLMSFLYLHYIGFPEKHQAGLRVGVMQYALLAAVSLYRVALEPTSAKNKAVALKSLIIQGVFLGISVVGMLNAPKPPKRKSA